MNKLYKLLSILLVSFSLNGCDDSPQYEEQRFFNISDIVVEVGDVLEIGNIIKQTDEYEIKITNNKLADFEDYYIKALAKGETTLTITKETKRQTVKLSVIDNGTYVDPYKFSKELLEGKNLAVFGDSVTAVATIGNAAATYASRFASHYGMNLLKNYAIGGTTATYTYFGSNIYKEYGESKSEETTKVSHIQMKATLMRVHDAVESFDMDEADKAMEELVTYEFSEDMKEMVEKLGVYVADVAMEEVIKLTEDMCDKLSDESDVGE